MEHLAAAVGVVAMFLEVLWQCRKVAHKVAPVAVEIVQVQGVWTSTGQQRVATGCTQRLLMGKSMNRCSSQPDGLT